MTYDELFLKNTLLIVIEEVRSLSLWSAYNGDKYNDLIHKIKEDLKNLRMEVYGQKDVKG